MTVQDWLGKDNKLGIDIWCKKYQRGTETFDEWLERVSGGDEEVANLIREKKFILPYFFSPLSRSRQAA